MCIHRGRSPAVPAEHSPPKGFRQSRARCVYAGQQHPCHRPGRTGSRAASPGSHHGRLRKTALAASFRSVCFWTPAQHSVLSIWHTLGPDMYPVTPHATPADGLQLPAWLAASLLVHGDLLMAACQRQQASELQRPACRSRGQPCSPERASQRAGQLPGHQSDAGAHGGRAGARCRLNHQ